MGRIILDCFQESIACVEWCPHQASNHIPLVPCHYTCNMQHQRSLMATDTVCRSVSCLSDELITDFSTNAQMLPSQSHVVNEGATFSILCAVDGSADIGRNFVILNKVIVDESGEEKSYRLAENNNLEIVNVDDSRYAATAVELETNGFNFTFEITDARVEDSGNFTCGVSHQDESEYKRLEVNVLKDIASITLTVDDEEISEDKEQDLASPVDMKFRCSVTGSNPAPTIRFYRNTGEDITTLLDDVQMSYSIERSVVGGKQAMQALSVTTVLEGSLHVDSHSSHLPIYCSAHVASLSPSQSYSVTYRFQGYPPEFSKCAQQVMIAMHQRMNVTCRVDADPPVSSAYFYWYLPQDPANHNLMENKDLNVTLIPVPNKQIVPGHPEALWERKGSYFGITYKDGTDMVMILEIEDMQMQMYRNHYFVAVNEHGSKTHTVSFIKDPSQPVVRDAATANQLSLLVFIFAAIGHTICQ
ncbi:hypothetical protein CAPTEDRAFT_219354 [Capitella teleta]|uniref:Ig-like domain-containing protein n=1 Tax=Capitella teleta TaxID=283909 RepID=R7U543_CAPTE|nr:hypothetical protein CAPTEDRAFT_219354 [Capitella teleta]|eukprot:ELU01465.1 hypothetical protein CAPTEDRAFT_219354 [Capitella teleta]